MMIIASGAMARRQPRSVFLTKNWLCLVHHGLKRGCFAVSSTGNRPENGPRTNPGWTFSSSSRKGSSTCSLLVGIVQQQQVITSSGAEIGW